MKKSHGDNKLVDESNYERINESEYFLLDKWGNHYPILTVYNKLIDEISWAVKLSNVSIFLIRADSSLGSLFERLSELDIQVLRPFDY